MTRDIILHEITQVAKEQSKPLAPVHDDLVLLESGLDSLCFAVIVARLEQKLGVDPFNTEADIEYPITFKDFVRFYDPCAN
jgi:acyl carrier protein